MVLVIVMMVATLLLIALTAVLPSVYQEGRREREEELIFRGTQYARAVALFHRQFNRYPVSIKELLGTNGMRFLRKEYRDPMDPKGKWRFIHINAQGVLLDSKNQPLSPNPNNPNNPAGVGQGMPGGSAPGGKSFMAGSSTTGFQSGAGGMGTPSFTGGFGQSGSTSSFFGNQNQMLGAYIAGVAATSHHESIKVWQKHHHYDEWEFVGIDRGIFGVQVGVQSYTPGQSGMGLQQSPGLSQGSFGASPQQPNFGSSPN